MKAFGYLCYLT